MEIKAILKKPYEEIEGMDFIVEQNHQLGYEIKETDEALEAWGYTEEEIAQQEKERIAKLTCTKRVLALGLQDYGLTYPKLKEFIATDEQAQLEWDLCVELERSNPLLDIMGAKLGITPTQLDNIFKLANGEEINDTTDKTNTDTISKKDTNIKTSV